MQDHETQWSANGKGDGEDKGLPLPPEAAWILSGLGLAKPFALAHLSPAGRGGRGRWRRQWQLLCLGEVKQTRRDVTSHFADSDFCSAGLVLVCDCT